MTGELLKSVSFKACAQAREDMMARYRKIAELEAEILQIAAGFEDSHAFPGRIKLRAGEWENTFNDLSGDARYQVETMERIERDIRRGLWNHVANKAGLIAMLDVEGREQFRKTLAEKPPEFTEETILATFQAISDQRGAIMVRGLINAVKGIGSWCYKSNQPYKLGRRAVHHIGIWHLYEAVGKLDDLNRVFAKLDGKPEPDTLYPLFSRDRAVFRNTTASPYFEIRHFKNGNAHLYFSRPDLVEQANKMIASRYPHALAPDAKAA